jgi:hypothetical protein
MDESAGRDTTASVTSPLVNTHCLRRRGSADSTAGLWMVVHEATSSSIFGVLGSPEAIILGGRLVGIR